MYHRWRNVCTSWNLVVMAKFLRSQDFKTTFKKYLACIFLSVIANSKKPSLPWRTLLCNFEFFQGTEAKKSESQKHYKFSRLTFLGLIAQEKLKITLEQIFLTVEQNNYGNKIPFMCMCWNLRLCKPRNAGTRCTFFLTFSNHKK